MSINRLLRKAITGYPIIIFGVLAVVSADILRFTKVFQPAADPVVEVIRFVGLTLFFIGLVARLIYFDTKTDIASDQHKRIFGEIEDIKSYLGMTAEKDRSHWVVYKKYNPAPEPQDPEK